jgi:hypothetical protein
VSPAFWRRAGCGALLILLLAAVVLLAVHNLPYPGVWFDESVQIWIAQGAYPLGPLDGETLGGWRDVVRMNRYTNLDPGGFSLWLHVWTKGGLGLVWLRLSAYVFYLVMAALLARWALELTGSSVAACLAPFIPLAYGLVLSYAFEIRAYSLEIAGVIATGYALHRVVRAPGLLNHLLLGAICSVLLWSRYSFVVVAASAIGALACGRARAIGRSRDEWENLACLLVPFLNSGALIYRFMLRYQARLLHPGPSDPASGAPPTIEAPEYVKQWVLRAQSPGALVTTLRENFLSGPALPILVALGALACWPLLRRQRALAGWPGSRSFPAIATMALLAQIISAALSLAGLYPWNLGQKWSLYLHAVSIVCALYLASAGWWLGRHTRAAPILATAAMAAAVLLTVRAAIFHRTHWADISPALTQLDTMPLRRRSVFVGIYEVPTVRYFYELGPHRGRGSYPEAFRFQRLGEAEPIDARQECLQYVVSPLDPATLATRFSGVDVSPTRGRAGRSLSRIDADGVLPAHCAALAAAAPTPE